MSICPFAKLQLLPESGTQTPIEPDQIIVHTAVDAPGLTNLYNYFDNPGVGVESHFYINRLGTIIQGMDTHVRADANYKANRRNDGKGAVSIETEDDGDPEANPWNDNQIASLIKLINWLADEHNIPRTLCESWDSPGLGWHSMWSFKDPIRQTGAIDSPWTPTKGKTCPGKVRCWQFRTKVVPALEPAPVIDGTGRRFSSEEIETMKSYVNGLNDLLG